MANHKHGEMDIKVQEKTFNGFISMVTKGSIGIIVPFDLYRAGQRLSFCTAAHLFLAHHLALAACGGGDPIWAPDDVVNAKIYRGTGQKSITLYTMINVWSGNGAHSSLLIDASQRVMFDPAGSFKHETIPERNDVLFGISPRVEEFYVSYHARQTYYVEGQRIVVSDEIAERALQLVMANGAVPKSACALAVSKVLRDIARVREHPPHDLANPHS